MGNKKTDVNQAGATPMRDYPLFERYAQCNTANAKGKTEDPTQSNATENAIDNARGDLTGLLSLICIWTYFVAPHVGRPPPSLAQC